VQWTLKEAYAKGRGLGLKLDFAGFGFADAGGTWHLDPAPGDEPRRQDWRFVSFAPWPGACAALAVLTAHGGALDWRMVRLTP
jgi:4'-phosphopantetheinyl transferase